jgi:hypothetical protein
MLSAMDYGLAAASSAWARLAGVPTLQRCCVVTDPASWLAPRGWIGILALGDTVTVAVPRAEVGGPVRAALEALSPEQAVDPQIVGPRMPPTRSSLGPAPLFYPGAGYEPPDVRGEEVRPGELAGFLEAAPTPDLLESGFEDLDFVRVFVSRDASGSIAAAAAYRRWPNGAAHLSVLTHPALRRRGHGRTAAGAALRGAIADGLLAQWRARPEASQGLALALGLVGMGAQLCFEPL